MGDGVLRDFEPTPDDAMCDCAYARRARAAGERICDLGASLRFAQRGFFDLLPDFLMTQVPVFAMSWEAVWCTEYHGIVPKVVPACTGGTWVLYVAYFGLPDFEFAARYSLRLNVYGACAPLQAPAGASITRPNNFDTNSMK